MAAKIKRLRRIDPHQEAEFRRLYAAGMTRTTMCKKLGISITRWQRMRVTLDLLPRPGGPREVEPTQEQLAQFHARRLAIWAAKGMPAPIYDYGLKPKKMHSNSLTDSGTVLIPTMRGTPLHHTGGYPMRALFSDMTLEQIAALDGLSTEEIKAAVQERADASPLPRAIDWSKIDWEKVAAFIATIVALFK